jgi:hypothetical protein
VSAWQLKRTHQCEKCPWRVETDPFDIPNGYSEAAHRDLARTIAEPGSMRPTGHAFACHEHDSADEVYCVGWLMNQIGPGNNIPLRMQMLSCDNRSAIRLRGEQHETFEDTLP